MSWCPGPGGTWYLFPALETLFVAHCQGSGW
jgi:hypothetical protein